MFLILKQKINKKKNNNNNKNSKKQKYTHFKLHLI